MKEQMQGMINKISIKGKETMIALVLIGIILAVMAIPLKGEKQGNEEKKQMEVAELQVCQEAYEAKLEQRLEDILSQIEGVGRVKVMITLQASSKEVVEKDISTEQSRENETEDLVSQSSISKEENTVYSETDAGNVPYVVQEIYPKIEGVLVVAEGGDNSLVNLAIVEAIEALFDVDAHKIKIVKMITD